MCCPPPRFREGLRVERSGCSPSLPQAVLHEVWRVETHSRLGVDVHSFLGQSVTVDLNVKGDRFVRRVACYSSSPASVSFEPGHKMKIPPGR